MSKVESVDLGKMSPSGEKADWSETDVRAPDQWKEKAVQMVKDNQDLFALSDLDLSKTETVTTKIDTGDAEPIRLKPYKTPVNNRKVIEKAVDDMLAADKDKEKTALACHRGLFQFRVMPFGLSRAPSIFVMLMSIVLQGLEDFACAYLYDILIFSKTAEEHEKHIEEVFRRLREHKLKLKLPKCTFSRQRQSIWDFKLGLVESSPIQRRSRPSMRCQLQQRSER